MDLEVWIIVLPKDPTSQDCCQIQSQDKPRSSQDQVLRGGQGQDRVQMKARVSEDRD